MFRSPTIRLVEERPKVRHKRSLGEEDQGRTLSHYSVFFKSVVPTSFPRVPSLMLQGSGSVIGARPRETTNVLGCGLRKEGEKDEPL